MSRYNRRLKEYAETARRAGHVFRIIGPDDVSEMNGIKPGFVVLDECATLQGEQLERALAAARTLKP